MIISWDTPESDNIEMPQEIQCYTLHQIIKTKNPFEIISTTHFFEYWFFNISSMQWNRKILMLNHSEVGVNVNK